LKKNFKNIDYVTAYQSKFKANRYKQKRKAIMLQPYLKIEAKVTQS